MGRIGTLFFFFSFLVQLKGQIDTDFINHLYYNDLHSEHKSYLRSLSDQSVPRDSLCLFKAKYALLNGVGADLFSNGIDGGSESVKDTSFFNLASGFLIRNNSDFVIDWFSNFKGYELPKRSVFLKKAYGLTLEPNLDPDFLPPSLHYYFNDYATFQKKKPWVSALMSSVVPGSGKLYLGRSRTFFSSLLTNAFFGLQTYESIKVNGVKNYYTIISAGVFSVFYISNIYGSYQDTKRVKWEKKRKYLNEVGDYYSSLDPLYQE